MRFQDILLIFVINCVIIYILHTFQKKAINESLKNLKKEIGDLEDLVAAIIEEFEEIADSTIPKESGDVTNASNNSLKSNDIDKTIHSAVEPDINQKLFDNLLESNISGQSFHNSLEANSPALKLPEVEQLSGVKPKNVPETGYHPAPHGQSQRQIDISNIKDPKHKLILELWSQGLTVEEISKKLEKGRGEIQLILGLYKRS